MSGSQAKYLDTRGNGTLGVGICDRCSTKRPLGELMSDPNIPGLKVCRAASEGCIDVYDPYRLPARMPDPIKLPFNRPDQFLDSGLSTEDFLRPNSITGLRITMTGGARITEDGRFRVIEGGG